MSKRMMILLLLLSPVVALKARLKLPALISDSMVLQRDMPIQIWGWNDDNKQVNVSFNGKTYKTKAGASGKWKLTLPAMKAGGPFLMKISTGDTTIRLNDIMIGDVWLCSGQSNMEFTVNNAAPLFPDEIANSANTYIREFHVNQEYSFTPKQDLNGRWKPAGPANTGRFTAAGYFMAKALYEKYKIPVGLIHSSWGATPAETWVSKEGLKLFDSFVNKADFFKQQYRVDSVLQADKDKIEAWFNKVALADSGLPNKWFNPAYNAASWKPVIFPGFFEQQGLPHYDGVVWVRKEIDLPEEMTHQDAILELGAIDDADDTYFNGVKVGTSDNRYIQRKYKVPASLLKKGKNLIAIRIIDMDGFGGFLPRNTYRFISGNKELPLAGEWSYQPGGKVEAFPRAKLVRMQNQPAALFNSMIAPLIPYAFKGVAWYQGEANVGRAEEYKKLLPALIADWRNHWRQGNFPFLLVQLANYLAPPVQPGESSWAELREAQLVVAKQAENCGMAVAIDVGEADDIHPLDKKTVGYRLALAAQKIALKENIVSSGPLYQSMKVVGNTVELSFSNIGSGLIVKGDTLKQFAIAGENKKFVWANAVVKGDKVIVSASQVNKPVAVRYAWAHNPEGCNLYNKEGLPASPFRTDAR